MTVFGHTSRGLVIGTVLFSGGLRRAIFFFSLILEMVGYSKGGESKGEQGLKKVKKFLKNVEDGITSKCTIYTSLGGLAIERSPWKFKKTGNSKRQEILFWRFSRPLVFRTLIGSILLLKMTTELNNYWH